MGPIEKPANLIPQFLTKRTLNYQKIIDGLRQILWGLFKKIVIADNCGVFVNEIFGNFHQYNGSTLLIGAFLYSIQIYSDFSGYSDIAIGTARLFNFDLMQNFAFPYFSKNIAEFWRRWHISLTKWLTNYIFFPVQMKFRNLRIYGNVIAILSTFFICGLWHGANWTFIVWGLLNGIYLVIYMFFNKGVTPFISAGNNFSKLSLKDFTIILTNFLITIFAWIFFRSTSIKNALDYILGIFSSSFFKKPEVTGFKVIPLIIFMFIIEWLQRYKEHGLEFRKLKMPLIFRWAFYYAILFLIIYYGTNTTQTGFIYRLF